MEIPAPAQDVLAQYSRQTDELLPDLIDSLHLIGSVALNAYRHGRSDIDFITVVTTPPTDTELATLADIHAALPETPMLDGLYITAAQLRGDPDGEPTIIHATEGTAQAVERELPAITRYELHRHAITLRGQAPHDHGLHINTGDLNTWLIDNLTGYWARYATDLRRTLTNRPPDQPANPETIAWAASGPARLHCTLTTGDIISKQDALIYAKEHFPHTDPDLFVRCLAWRNGDAGDFTTTDVHRAADHIDEVIAASLTLPAAQ